jgi:anti-sigma regulatory factor (Ser/Thr protein kinase)
MSVEDVCRIGRWAVAEALTASFDLPAEPTAAGRARRLVTELLAAWGRAEDADVARLLVSEAVTNAVRFIGSRPCLRLDVIAQVDRLRIIVADGTAVRPVLRAPKDTEEAGRGMQLIATLATEWGVLDTTQDHSPGKQVWFELAAARLGPRDSNFRP